MIATIKTCGNCGHHVVMHGCLRRHRCDHNGSLFIHPAMGACENWAHRPAARIRVEPGEIMRAQGKKAREGGAV